MTILHAARRSLPGISAALVATVLAGCAHVGPLGTPGDVADSPWASESVQRTAAPAGGTWQHHAFPGKTSTAFAYDRLDGRHAIAARADTSASMLRQPLRVEPAELGALQFSWNVPGLIAGADLARRDADDSPVRIVLAFDGDRSRFSAKDTMLSELARTLTGEEMPYATLMYVWCNHRPTGSVVHSPRTDRIRKLVVESGPARLGGWLDYGRDIRADYLKAFGEEPGALVGIAIMTDTDNTRSKARAWYGPVRLDGASPRPIR